MNCRYITDEGLFHLSTLPLQELNLMNCREITDDGLVHLQQLPLQELNLMNCREITDVGLGYIKQLPLLQQLCVGNCVHLSVTALAQLSAIHRPGVVFESNGCWVTTAHRKPTPLLS
jgi:hypothetical protein